MADYYPLISRSIEAIADPTPEVRQMVYDRAKQALVEQLRLLNPPLPEIDIMRERLALESTIRRFERSYRAGIYASGAGSQVAVPQDNLSAQPVEPELSSSIHPAPVVAEYLEPSTTLDRAESLVPDYHDEPENELQSVVARQSDETDIAESYFTETDLNPEDLTTNDHNNSEKLAEESNENNDKRNEYKENINLYVENIQKKQFFLTKNIKNYLKNKYFYRVTLIFIVLIVLVISVMKIAQILEANQSDIDAQNVANKDSTMIETGKKIDEKAPVVVPERPDSKTASVDKSDTKSGDPTTGSMVPEIEQRAVFLEEPASSNLEPVRFTGQVIWKLETYPSSVGGVSDTGARATITVKDIGLTADIVIRQNKDQDSANSHMIEVKFTTDAGSERGKVRDIGVPELRSEENLRGAQLVGIPVPVTDNVFLIGMNALPVESQKNLELLRKMNWILIPIRLENGKRSALLFEKGKTGNRVIEDTFQTWK